MAIQVEASVERERGKGDQSSARVAAGTSREQLATQAQQRSRQPEGRITRYGWAEGEGGPLERVLNDVDRLFARLGVGNFPSVLGVGGLGRLLSRAWSPEIEVSRRQGELVLRADLPGLSADDIELELDNGELTIRGERRDEAEERRGDVNYTERFYGAFQRSILVPKNVAPEQVRAVFKNGVLEVSVDLDEARPNRGRIEVRAGQEPRQAQSSQGQAGQAQGAQASQGQSGQERTGQEKSPAEQQRAERERGARS